MKNNGLYIAFIGLSGCGKDTIIALLKEYIQEKYPELLEYFDFTREPGGTLYADHLREVVKHRELTPEQELEHYALARGNSLANRVAPKLRQGMVVVSNRCFLDGVYQAEGRELGWDRVWEVNEPMVKGIVPDVVVFMDVGREVALKRSGAANPDKFDNEDPDFWARNEDGYPKVIEWFKENFPDSEVIWISDKEGKQTEGEMFETVIYMLEPHFYGWEVNRQLVVREREAS